MRTSGDLPEETADFGSFNIAPWMLWGVGLRSIPGLGCFSFFFAGVQRVSSELLDEVHGFLELT